MNKKGIKVLLMKMRTSDNESSVNYLLGQVDMMSEEDLLTKLKQHNINETNIKQFLTDKIVKGQIQHKHSEYLINVNKMFCYGKTGDTIHMHLIPKDLRGTKAKLGDEAFYQLLKDQLEDFLSRLQDVFRADGRIKTLFAVSPIFYNSNISAMHEELGFNKIIEIDSNNQEDKMSVEQKKYFLDMFNKNNKNRRRVYYTSMSREKLLNSEYTRIPKEEKTISDN